MMIKKCIIVVMELILLLGMSGCTGKINESHVDLDMFDMKKGMEVSERYLANVSSGNIDIANEFCSPELINSNKELTSGVSNITSFTVDSTIEGNNFGYFLFNVIRSSGIEPKSDLENFTVKVEKADGVYIISEIKAKSQKELYVKGNGLRIIGDEGGKSNLVVSLNNLPKDTYLRENKLMLFKDKVPNDSFGNVALSFTGKKIAITTTNKIDSYVCIAYIDEALVASSDVSEGGAASATPNGMEELQQALEKSIAKKITSVDLLKGSKINKFIFSKEEDVLDVEYTNVNNLERINLYKTDDGSSLDAKFNEIFPDDKYNISSGSFDENNFNFKVSIKNNESNFDNELIGEYKIDLLTLEIKKL